MCIRDRIGVAGHTGEVIDIDLRYTTIEADGKKVLIPNSTLFTKEISILNLSWCVFFLRPKQN